MSFSRLPTRRSMGASVRARNGWRLAPSWISFTRTWSRSEGRTRRIPARALPHPCGQCRRSRACRRCRARPTGREAGVGRWIDAIGKDRGDICGLRREWNQRRECATFWSIHSGVRGVTKPERFCGFALLWISLNSFFELRHEQKENRPSGTAAGVPDCTSCAQHAAADDGGRY